jgi:small-conductance mechanosensitive channel
LAPTSGELKRPLSATARATTFVVPPKKAIAPGAALQPLDINQEGLSLREAQNQKRKAITSQEEEPDQESRDLEAIHQQVQRKRKKMLQLAKLQRKIDEAAKEMRHTRKTTKDEGHNRENFVKKAQAMMTNGMMIFTMVTLLLMMLLL